MELQYETQSVEELAETGLSQARERLTLQQSLPENSVNLNPLVESVSAPVSADYAARNLLTTLGKIEQKKRTVDAATSALMNHIYAVRRQRRRRALYRTIGIVALITLLIATRGRILQNWWYIYIFWGGGEAVDRAGQKRRKDIEALTLAGDPRTVGVLALALTEDMKQDNWVLQRALIQLLPRIRAGDAAFISASQMNALITLTSRPHLETQLAILRAFEQIGDARAIPTVERLCTHPDTRLREQAEQCMPFLYERARRANESATLLRGAQAPTLTAPDQLLRPAMSSSQTPVEQLLRPR